MQHPVYPAVIIGSGCAGSRAPCKPGGEVLLPVITADSGPFYSKPMPSDALASNKPPMLRQ